MSSESLHEAAEKLSPATIDRHRATVSLMEELEAVDWYDQRIEVFGSKGMLRAGNLTPTTVERSGEQSTCGDNPWPNFQTRYTAAYAAELSSFINSVERRRPAEIPPEDSRQVLLLCEAAKKSATTGQPVKVGKN